MYILALSVVTNYELIGIRIKRLPTMIEKANKEKLDVATLG